MRTSFRRVFAVLAASMAVLIPSAASVAAAPVGQSGDDVSPFIIGGDDAKRARSWMASIQLGDRHRCGGELIRPQWVLTAAHCLVAVKPGETKVRIGSLDRTKGGVLVGVKKTKAHPEWIPEGDHNDIAVIQLDRPVWNKPVALSRGLPKAGTPTRILGWGKDCDSNPDDPACWKNPVNLQELATVVTLASKCGWFDPKSEICTVSRDGQNKQACVGDSGGPQVEEQHGREVLVGVTRGDGDDGEMRPNVCTTNPQGGQGAGVWTGVGPHLHVVKKLMRDCGDFDDAEALERDSRAVA
ncbi:serine protease [Lentzea sp. BCCO 10_0856]|uniref:Serine protease n=1 Tax=Lentzea miocenica TaxID=3095431 RepID=A0ABU4THF6_9PSEU|nr:serine protease [Lentzea sp. BCCO 10_0856]MDX8037627.1 serine protease [Lentzea sp. BCCO 10_0856]